VTRTEQEDIMPSQIPVSDVNVWSDENLLDPFPMYRALRDMGPVVYLERHKFHAVTRFADVKQVLGDWETFSSASGVSFNDDLNTAIAGSLVGSDPPRHRHYRGILERPLAPAEMKKVRDRIQELAAGLVADTVRKGEVEVVSEVASYLPVVLVAELVGLPPEGRENMIDWATAGFNALAPAGVDRVADSLVDMAGMAAYFEDPDLVDHLRPGSWASRLCQAARDGEITHAEFLNLLQMNYILPALDTTIHATTNLIWLLAHRPDIWAELKARPALVGRAVNEALRLEGPVQAFSRKVTKDALIDGVTVPAGEWLFVSFAAANRDERRYPDPDRFDIHRDAADHVAFGYDEHVCLGRNLATLEMTMLLSELLRSVETLEVKQEKRLLHNSLRGFEQLRVEFG
jgi:cytochrome P450